MSRYIDAEPLEHRSPKLRALILEQPTADVEPIKHGHWEVVSDGYGGKAYICECSECTDTVWVYKDADRKWNYCPNCGAKMDGEEQDNAD